MNLEKEIERLFEKRCNPDTVTDCEGKTLRALCKRCKDRPRRRRIHPYVAVLYEAYMLQEAGFPFQGDAFSLQFWMDLGLLRQQIHGHTRMCPL